MSIEPVAWMYSGDQYDEAFTSINKGSNSLRWKPLVYKSEYDLLQYINSELEQRITELEAQKSEPVATMSNCCKLIRIGVHQPEVMHSGLCKDRHGGKLGETFYLYTAPPTAQAATEAAYRKAAEVCEATYEQGNQQTLHGLGERWAALKIRDEIRALSGTDALRELMIQVAVIVDAVPCELKLSEIKKIVDSVIKGDCDENTR